MTVKSTQLEQYMDDLKRLTPRWETVKTHMSRNARVLYSRLSMDGKFPEFLMTREYKSGRVHLVKVR